MKKLLIFATLATLVTGCGSDPEEQVNASTSPGVKGSFGEPTAPTRGSGGTNIAHEPPKDGIPAGGIMLQPQDPNDPKFKPDPKLGGGGG